MKLWKVTVLGMAHCMCEVEVEAEDEESAKDEAEDKASELIDSEWESAPIEIDYVDSVEFIEDLGDDEEEGS